MLDQHAGTKTKAFISGFVKEFSYLVFEYLNLSYQSWTTYISCKYVYECLLFVNYYKSDKKSEHYA